MANVKDKAEALITEALGDKGCARANKVREALHNGGLAVNDVKALAETLGFGVGENFIWARGD